MNGAEMEWCTVHGVTRQHALAAIYSIPPGSARLGSYCRVAEAERGIKDAIRHLASAGPGTNQQQMTLASGTSTSNCLQLLLYPTPRAAPQWCDGRQHCQCQPSQINTLAPQPSSMRQPMLIHSYSYNALWAESLQRPPAALSDRHRTISSQKQKHTPRSVD